jgi:hypothetical protein
MKFVRFMAKNLEAGRALSIVRQDLQAPGFLMRAIAVAAFVTFAVNAAAQDDTVTEGRAPDADASATDDSFGGDQPAASPAPKGDVDGGSAVAPEAYLVRPGDTLWNLSQRFLNNPWYWPKVWSYNQELDNPNWIYPGTQIRFYPGTDAPIVQADESEGEEPAFDDMGGGGFEGDGVGDRFADVGNDRRRREFFVPTDKLDEAGQVQNSPEEKQLLAVNDRVYVKLKKQRKPGDVLQLFQPGRELRHPVTGAALGRMVEMVGQIRVDQLSRDQALGTVTDSWDVIERGVYVGELPVETDPVRVVENEKNVKAYVVDAGPRGNTFVGDNYTIVVDKGTSDGVGAGNVFTLVRAGDPYTRQYSGLADEDIGEVVIVEASKNVSTGLLLKAGREIVAGDRAEMRVNR